ncbi:MAG: hypothetical protein FWF12_02340 [Betaproteobacteria bacterium]|nr:hypothetical protein [Betaproteobacteria bacterium]
MRISAIIIGLILSANLHAETRFESSSICTAKDKVYFSCTTKNRKILSLCGKKEGGIYYRFGKPGKVELEYPSGNIKNEDSLSLFFYNHYTRWMVDYFTVTFQNHGYTYLIQDLKNNEEETKQITQNIVIYNNPDQTDGKTISCISDVISDLRPLIYIIPCDKEAALGCSKNDGYLDSGVDPK